MKIEFEISCHGIVSRSSEGMFVKAWKEGMCQMSERTEFHCFGAQ